MSVVVLRSVLLSWLLLAAGQSRHLRQQWAQLARQPAGSPGRAAALWQLAWESELPPTRQDSLAALATAAARQLRPTPDTLPAAVWAARRLVYAGAFAPAQARLLAALPVARRRPDPWLAAQVLLLLARNHWGTATHARAEAYLHQAWALTQAPPALALRARVAWQLGTYYVDSGKALGWFFRSLPLAERAGDEALQVYILSSMAYHYQQLDEPARARAYYARALRLARPLRSAPALCRALTMSGDCDAVQGRPAQARLRYREALRYAAQPNLRFTIAINLAELPGPGGAPGSAWHYARLARRLARNRYERHVSYSALARLWLAAGQPDSARRYGQWAYAEHPADTLHPAMRDLCAVLAQTYARLGDWRRAYAYQHRLQAYNDSLGSDWVRARAERAEQRYADGLQQQQRLRQQQQQELVGLRRQRTLALAALAGLLLLGATVGAGLALRRRQHRRLEALRTRLAADLHDDVGALLTQLAFDTAVLQGQPGTAPEQRPRLARMATASQQAVRQLREVVWSVDSRHDSFASLLDRLRDYAHEVLPPAGLEVDFHAEPVLYHRELPISARTGLYRIYKEALHNVVKHARATEVTIRLGLLGRALCLTVDDDGPGAPTAPLPLHHGLANMARRAAELGGIIAYEAAPGGTGWRVRLTLPLG